MSDAGIIAITYPPHVPAEQLAAHADRVVLLPGGREELTDLASRLSGGSGGRRLVGLVVRSECRIDAALLDRLPDLRFVVRAGSGLDGIDTTQLDRRGIELVRNPAVAVDAVAELAWTGLSALTRRIPVAMAMVRRGEHAKHLLMGEHLADLSIAVWGSGPVGRAFAATACRLGAARVTNVASPVLRDPCSADGAAVFGHDVHVLCLPLLPSTRHLFGPRFLDRVRAARPYLCNIGRYELLDMAAAGAALAGDGLRGLYVDPVDPPHLPEVTDLATRLDGHNLLFTLHQGAQRRDVRARLDTWALHEALARADSASADAARADAVRADAVRADAVRADAADG